MHLYNKSVLIYAQIARSGPKSMICDIGGLSSLINSIEGGGIQNLLLQVSLKLKREEHSNPVIGQHFYVVSCMSQPCVKSFRPVCWR